MYSDAPCLGARKVDVEPTRGLNKSTGHELSGSDVQRERMNEAIAKALRPITGQSARERQTSHRRFKLPAESKIACSQLDRDIAEEEATERRALLEDRALSQKRLFELRSRARDLGC